MEQLAVAAPIVNIPTERTITVYSTVGQSLAEITTSAQTWGELKQEIEDKGVNLSGMQAVVGENENTLESNNATLMDTDFTLFLLPAKVDSGNLLEDGEDWGTEGEYDTFIEDDSQEESGPKDPISNLTLKGAVSLIEKGIADIQRGLAYFKNQVTPDDPKISSMHEKARQIAQSIRG